MTRGIAGSQVTLCGEWDWAQHTMHTTAYNVTMPSPLVCWQAWVGYLMGYLVLWRVLSALRIVLCDSEHLYHAWALGKDFNINVRQGSLLCVQYFICCLFVFSYLLENQEICLCIYNGVVRNQVRHSLHFSMAITCLCHVESRSELVLWYIHLPIYAWAIRLTGAP